MKLALARAGERRHAKPRRVDGALQLATAGSLDRAQAPATERPARSGKATRPRLHLAAAWLDRHFLRVLLGDHR